MIGSALGWKYDNTPGICTKNGKITKWPSLLGPEPNAAELVTIVAEYEAFKFAEGGRAEILSLISATEKDDRLAEDLIDLLIAKGVFVEDELTQNAKDKLSNRRTLRGQLQ